MTDRDLETKIARELAKREIEHNRKLIAKIDGEILKLQRQRRELETEIERLEFPS